MKSMRVVAVLAAVLALGALLRADTVVLNDGTVLQGQVTHENVDEVVLMDHGTQRTFQRSLVARVEFDTGGPGAPDEGDAAPPPDQEAAPGGDDVPPQQEGYDTAPEEGDAVPSAPTQDEQDYALGVSDYYQVPPDQVWGFEEQGVPYEELPVVFYVSRRAGVAPGLIVGMRLRGMSWADICMHFGLGPGIFYWNDLFSEDLGGPYGDIYYSFHRHPYRRWRWGLIALSDADIINCVNLHFDTAYWHLRPRDVVRWRRLGHPFFWAGYGRHRYARFHGSAGWGARGRAGWGARGRAGWNAGTRVGSGRPGARFNARARGRAHGTQGARGGGRHNDHVRNDDRGHGDDNHGGYGNHN